MADQMMLPLDYQSEIDALQKRQMLAQLLQKQALSGAVPQSQGRMAARINPLAAMTTALSGYLGAKTETDAQKGIRGVQQRYMSDANTALDQFSQAPEDQQQLLGAKSPFPQVQALAKALQERRTKQLEQTVGALKDADPALAANIAASGRVPNRPIDLSPLPDIEERTDSVGNTYLVRKNRKGEATPTYAPKAPVVNVDTAGETAAAKAVGGKLPERFAEVTDAAKKSISAMDTARRVQDLLKDPAVLTGFGANVAEGFASLGAKLNFTGPDAAAKTQSLLGELASSTLDNVKRLPGAITEKERPFLELASSGKITWTPEAIQRLADISMMANHNTLVGLQADYNSLASMPMAQASGATQAWLFPKGWNFSADPKKYTETGQGTNRYRYNEVPSAPAKPAWTEPPGWNALTPAEQARYKKLKGL